MKKILMGTLVGCSLFAGQIGLKGVNLGDNATTSCERVKDIGKLYYKNNTFEKRTDYCGVSNFIGIPYSAVGIKNNEVQAVIFSFKTLGFNDRADARTVAQVLVDNLDWVNTLDPEPNYNQSDYNYVHTDYEKDYKIIVFAEQKIVSIEKLNLKNIDLNK